MYPFVKTVCAEGSDFFPVFQSTMFSNIDNDLTTSELPTDAEQQSILSQFSEVNSRRDESEDEATLFTVGEVHNECLYPLKLD